MINVFYDHIVLITKDLTNKLIGKSLTLHLEELVQNARKQVGRFLHLLRLGKLYQHSVNASNTDECLL
jgi:hypothetical protein